MLPDLDAEAPLPAPTKSVAALAIPWPSDIATDADDHAPLVVPSNKGWRRLSISERPEALGRIGGITLTVALTESGGLPHERRAECCSCRNGQLSLSRPREPLRR